MQMARAALVRAQRASGAVEFEEPADWKQPARSKRARWLSMRPMGRTTSRTTGPTRAASRVVRAFVLPWRLPLRLAAWARMLASAWTTSQTKAVRTMPTVRAERRQLRLAKQPLTW
jgi:hypothetical protein